MQYSTRQYIALLAQLEDFNSQNAASCLSALRTFLVNTYQGECVACVTKNFPDLAKKIKKLSKIYKVSPERFLFEECDLTLVSYTSTDRTVLSIANAIMKEKQKNVVVVEKSPVLFQRLTELKELLATQGAFTEEAVLKRFSSALELKQLNNQYPLPSRAAIFFFLAKAGAPIPTQKLLGKTAYAKLVYMAAEEEMSASEWVSTYVLPYTKKRTNYKPASLV